MKQLNLILIGIVAILLPISARADIANLLVNSNLQDLSFKYLQDIFGVVDGVLHGSGTQIMGQLFGAFNSAVLTLGFIIMSYVFFVSTINTAHEGELMGKKWSSIWIPLRIVASTALIVPKATGYCAIQIFFMGVVVSGVVAANKVMLAGLSYLKDGGVLIQSSPPPDAGKVVVAGNILKSLTCMNGVYNIVLNDSVVSKTTLPTKFVPTNVSVQNATGNQRIDFPSADAIYAFNNTQYRGICGSVTWTAQNRNVAVSTDGTSVAQDLRGIAVQQMILDLQPFAQTLADNLVPPQFNIDVPVAPQLTVQQIVTANNLGLIFAAADYKGIMMPFYNQRAELFANASKEIITNTAKQGWLMLGSLYFNIAQLNNNADSGGASDNVTANFTLNNLVGGYVFLNSKYKGQLSKLFCKGDTGSACTDTVVTNQTSFGTASTNVIDNYIYNSSTNTGAGGLYKAGTPATVNAAFGGGGGQIINAILSPLIGPLYGIIYNMQALMDAENQNADPIIAVSGLGSSLVALVTMVWFGVAAGIFGLALGISVLPCVNPGGFGILSFLTWFVPMFSVLLIGMFVAGAVMAFYVPLIPFILFTFAAIGWFAVVLEAMIAAPLVALGIAYPEQHEIFGKAEPAIMLLANVFLRPTLMVFGFFGGAILSHVGLWLLNKGYGVAWGWAVVSNLGNLGIFGILWALVAGLIIYMSLVLTVINQTFGLIHQLPDELMRWLNGGMKALGASAGDALGATQSQFKGGMEAIGSGMQKKSEESLKNANKDNKSQIKGGGDSGDKPPVDPSSLAG